MQRIARAVLVVEAAGFAVVAVAAGVYTASLVIAPDDGAEFAGIVIMEGLLVVFASSVGATVAAVLARLVRRPWPPALPIAIALHAIVAVIALRAR